MIERWLQITCDNEDCGETDTSTWPNMTVAEFLKEIRPCFVKVGKRHLCSTCAEEAKKRRGRP